MIPKLNWNRKNIGKILLFHEFNPFSKPIKKKIKNNQFNVKWFLNRFLFAYYKRNSAAKPLNFGRKASFNSISFLENRLDLILFRTNWFISYDHLNHAILTGKISLNNKIVKNKKIFLKKGDLIKVEEGFPIWKKKDIKYEQNLSRQISGGLVGFRKSPSGGFSFRFYGGSYVRINDTIYKNRFKNYMNWFKNKYNFLLKNPVYLEINNNIKSLIVLKSPQYKNIPYPKNLERNLRIRRR